MYKFCFIFLLFFFYSILGWLIECIYMSIRNKSFIFDRGFLIGPYCPVYGFGGLYMYLFLTKYYNDPFTLFIMAVFGTSLIEYLASYIMEKLFRARWWDYSNDKFNLEGRVCLKNAIFFGILGFLFVYILNPFYLDIINCINDKTLYLIFIFVFIVFLIDNILSFSIMSKLKSELFNIKKDSTSEIDIKVKEILESYSFYIKRLFKAFPKIRLRIPNGKIITTSIYNNLHNLELKKQEFKKKKKSRK